MTLDNFTTDPNLVNAEWAGAAADQVERTIEEADRIEAQAAADAQQKQAEEDELAARTTTPDGRKLDERDSRRDGTDWWNPADVASELWAAGTGGIRDTVSMGLTAKERFEDMTSGEMAKEMEEQGYYKPDYDPLGGDLNPMTTTWWGNMARGTVHFLSSALALKLAAKGLVVALPAALTAKVAGATGLAKLGAAARAGSLKAKFVQSSLVGAGTGAATDLLSEYSQDDNALGALKKQMGERFPQFLSGIATNDQDSPWMKTAKNVMEGLGIGEIFEVLGLGFKARFPGKKPAATKALTDSDKRVDGYFAKKEAEARAEEIAKLDAELTESVASEYFKNNNGAVFADLNEATQLAMKKEYAKGKKQFKDWTAPDETPDDRAIRKAEERAANVDEQILEEGAAQLDSPEYGAYKADDSLNQSTQGTAISQGRPLEVMNQVKEIRRQGFDGDLGSTDATVTVAQVRRSLEVDPEITGKELNDVLKQALGDERFRRMYDAVKADGKKPREVFKEAYTAYKKMVEGRNTSNMTLEEYFAPIDEELTFRTGGTDSMEAWAMKNVVIADLVNASNFKQLRDYGIAAREAGNVIDVWDVDGPARMIRDRLIYGIQNVKKSRMLISQEFKKLRTVQGEEAATKAFKERMSTMHNEAKEAVDMMFKIAMEAPSKDLQDALLESFSMSNKITNWEDLHAWMRTKLMGGSYKGSKADQGMLIKELQGVMVNSILSGPKTPVRAIMGTSMAGFARPLAQAIGGAMTFNGAQTREALSTIGAMTEAIPEAFKLFFTKLNSYWTGDLSTLKTRFSGYEKAEADWNAMFEFISKNGTDAEKATLQMANVARTINNNSFFSYSTKIMAATDDAFGHIMARARARQKAMQAALEVQSAKTGEVPVVDKELMKNFEDRFYNDFLDEEGNIDFDSDAALKYSQEEATLTRDLSGFTKGMENLFNSHPWAKPFFLFARTGINGLELTMKHMPIFNRLVKDERLIHNATADMANNKELMNIGISNAWELENAKAIQRGRQAMGVGVVSMASMLFMSDRLTGNGPMDKAQLRTWMAAGWKPRSIKIGDTWVSYDALEPFNSILGYVADVGDNMALMGEQWAEEKLMRIPLVLAQSATSKSYMAGLSQLVTLLSGNPENAQAIIANLMNNQIPLGGLRNEIGKVINPYMKELNRDLVSQIRNRNQWAEMIDGKNELPVRYDILNGQPIKDHSFATRMFNMISPIQLNLENSPGRTLLWNSGYDVNITVYANPDGVSLKDYPEVRSLYQKALGKQNLEAWLNNTAKRKDVQESIRQMEKDLASGRDRKEPRTYLANDLISRKFRDAQNKAWAAISNDPRVQRLIAAEKAMQSSAYVQNKNPDFANQKYDEATELLNIPK